MPGDCENCPNVVEIKEDISTIKSDIRHIAEGFDRIETEKQRQGDKIDQHNAAIAVLNERTKTMRKQATKSGTAGGAAGGGVLFIIMEVVKRVIGM